MSLNLKQTLEKNFQKEIITPVTLSRPELQSRLKASFLSRAVDLFKRDIVSKVKRIRKEIPEKFEEEIVPKIPKIPFLGKTAEFVGRFGTMITVKPEEAVREVFTRPGVRIIQEAEKIITGKFTKFRPEKQIGFKGKISRALFGEEEVVPFSETSKEIVKAVGLDPNSFTGKFSIVAGAIVLGALDVTSPLPTKKIGKEVLKEILKFKNLDDFVKNAKITDKQVTSLGFKNKQDLFNQISKSTTKPVKVDKEIVKESIRLSKPNKFFVREFNKVGKLEFREVKGKSIDTGFNIETFVSKDFVDKTFRITEAKTGLLISQAKTQKSAIENAKKVLLSKKNEIDKKVQEMITIALSPRFTKIKAVTPEVTKITPEIKITDRTAIPKGLGEAPSPVNKVQAKSIQQEVSATIPQAKSPLRAKISQELQNSEIVSSLPPVKQISNTKSISKEFSEYKKAEEGIKGQWIKVRETVQDSFIRVRKLQDKVFKGAAVPDDINISQARTLFDGRVHTKLEVIKDTVTKIDKEIVTTAKSLKISADEFGNQIDSFLHARHALERNAKLGDGAAGLTNVEAKKILKTIDSLPNVKEVKVIAEKISDLNKQTLKILLDAEVIDKELFDLLNKTYKNHIPLQRVMSETDDITQILSGKGFDVRSTGIKRAVGSDKPVADILTNVIANSEQAIIRSEKNLVDLTTLRFARANKSLGLFEEIKPKVIGKTFDEKFIKEQITDPLVLTLREKGKPVFLKINDKPLAVALKGINVEKTPALMRGITYLTRLYASLHTRFNYEFAFSNNIRDVQEMMVDIASRKGMGFGASVKALKKDPKSKKAVVDFLFGRDTEGAKLYKQMRTDGGTTGGLGLSTREQVELNIEKIRKLNRSKPRQAAVKAIEIIDGWNTIFEDATRLSVYSTALERGLSRNRAAFLAKESTVNFNKKGTAGPLINGLYMFSNASIQGTTKMLRAMKNPKVLGAVISSISAGVYAANEWNDSVDPDWRDKVTKWDRSSNLVIMLPTADESVRYITVPISWGLKPIKVAIEYIYDVSTGHGNLKDATLGVITAAAESYNPLAGDESILNTLTPTLLKVPMEISRNRAWYGNSIKPDNEYSNVPASAQYFKSLENSLSGRIAIGITKELSEKTKGAIEISPADVNYAFNQYIGGVGRSTDRIINTIIAVTTDKQLTAKERPVLNRFLKETDEEQVLQRLYYSEKEKVDKEKAKQKLEDVRRITPIYETAQMLIKEGKTKQAEDIVNSLSETDWKIYKTMKSSDKRRQTKSKQIQMFRVVDDVQKLLKQGNKAEAQRVVDLMTDEEFKAYQSVKKQLNIE